MNEEQKRREMQIEEMAQIICGRSKDDICLIDKTSCDSSCRWARNAEALYNAGYRNADEVRKETAREILQGLEERKERVKAFYGTDESVGVDIAIRAIKEILKQKGVEGEE